MSERKEITFDLATYKELKKLYGLALDREVGAFLFRGDTIVTDYAKYLLEYLAPKFGDDK